ncbi:hypothetical protein [Streptococcus suis]|nr:hypothetical protein [Streptococcus suis]
MKYFILRIPILVWLLLFSFIEIFLLASFLGSIISVVGKSTVEIIEPF